ncbi:hypothetical protein [Ralstonia pseudosolanacearum]|uniref:hypothetical protein n=1 Tax=Ralstonia pseudosolanacearum TaxID=1310165 RepID=UPI003CF2E566
MLKAIDFEILRGVEANGRISVPLARKPVRVATMLNESAFNEDQFLIHNRTVFLEDHWHDWAWENGRFRYYTRVASKADVLIVYEEADVEPPRPFDPMTGKRIDA